MSRMFFGSHIHKQFGIAYDYRASVEVEARTWRWQATIWRPGGAANKRTGSVEFISLLHPTRALEQVHHSIARTIDTFTAD